MNVQAHYKDIADVVRTVLIFVIQIYNLQLLDLKLSQIGHSLLKIQMVNRETSQYLNPSIFGKKRTFFKYEMNTVWKIVLT